MTDVYAGHSQFVLLTDNRRRWFDSRTVFLLIVVTVPIIIFCGIYTIILKGNESLLYPKSFTQVPVLLSHRAKVYSRHFKNQSNDILVPRPPSKDIDEFKLVCYYNFPANANSLQPQHIDPFLCTHIIVGFVNVYDNAVELLDSELVSLKAVIALKQTNPELKVLLSAGGAGSGGNDGFTTMVLNHENRKTFIRSIVNLVKNYGLDGVDLDWEFPNEDPAKDKHQKMHFVQLLEEIRHTIDKQNRHKFLLSAAVGAPVFIVDNSYDVMYMNKFVDFVNVMTYDFHFYSKLTPFTGLNSPLYGSEQDKGYFQTLNINYAVNYWVSKGMSREKMMVGLPTYSHTFRLTNPHNKGLYAPARGVGKLGSQGFADYSQVCKFLNLNQISPVFDLDAKSPYAGKGVEWLSFDNEQSLAFKTEYVRDNQFGGVMVYCLNSDDYMGTCKIDPNLHSKPFPLVNKIREILNKNYSIF